VENLEIIVHFNAEIKQSLAVQRNQRSDPDDGQFTSIKQTILEILLHYSPDIWLTEMAMSHCTAQHQV